MKTVINLIQCSNVIKTRSTFDFCHFLSIKGIAGMNKKVARIYHFNSLVN